MAVRNITESDVLVCEIQQCGDEFVEDDDTFGVWLELAKLVDEERFCQPNRDHLYEACCFNQDARARLRNSLYYLRGLGAIVVCNPNVNEPLDDRVLENIAIEQFCDGISMIMLRVNYSHSLDVKKKVIREEDWL